MLVGIVVGRRIVGVSTLVNVDLETLLALLAPAVQSVLTPGFAACRTRRELVAVSTRRTEQGMTNERRMPNVITV
jgi:hypothetical protein